MSKKKYKCVFCNKEFEGFGNNPAPVKMKGECCDKCNMEEVIPIRMLQSYGLSKVCPLCNKMITSFNQDQLEYNYNLHYASCKKKNS